VATILKDNAKTSKFESALLRFLVAFLIIYYYPHVKQFFFPSQMTRFEKMFRQSEMDGYQLAVDRKSLSKIILTVYNGGQSITTQIYRNVIRELEPEGDSRIFFSHAANSNAQGVKYLSRTKIKTDSKLKRVKFLEVTICDRIKDQVGRIQHDGHEPIYECAVPIREIKCKAAVQPDPYSS
jgi:hypothetical protein